MREEQKSEDRSQKLEGRGGARRVKFFVVTETALVALFGSAVRMRVAGVPEDAQVLAVSHNLLRRAFEVLVEHPTFEEVAMGEMAPMVGPVYVREVR